MLNSQILARGLTGRIKTQTSASVPNPFFNGGTPTNAAGELVVSTATPNIFVGGLGYANSGALSIDDSSGATGVISQGGLAQTPLGRLVCTYGALFTRYIAGLPVDDLGRLCIDPSGAPPVANVDLDFTVLPLSPLITYTRAGTATRVNAAGLVEVVAANAPRLDYNPTTLVVRGLLSEESRVNNATNSEDFTLWATKSNVTVAANTTVAPDGNTTADTLAENTNNSDHYLERGITIAANQAFSYSLWVKPNGRTTVWITLYSNSYADSIRGGYNFVTKVLTPSQAGTGALSAFRVVEYPNGWVRLTLSGQPSTAVVTDIKLRVMIVNVSTTYPGDGVSGFFLWGVQLEAGIHPTSYIPTAGSAVTRNADLAAISGANFSGFWNVAEGTMFAEGFWIIASDPGGLRPILGADDGTTAERMQIRKSSGSQSNFLSIDNNVQQFQALVSGSPTILSGVLQRMALAYKLNDYAIAHQGLSNSPLAGTLPTVNIIRMGAGTGLPNMNGHLRRFKYYNTRLLANQLQSITAPDQPPVVSFSSGFNQGFL